MLILLSAMLRPFTLTTQSHITSFHFFTLTIRLLGAQKQLYNIMLCSVLAYSRSTCLSLSSLRTLILLNILTQMQWRKCKGRYRQSNGSQTTGMPIGLKLLQKKDSLPQRSYWDSNHRSLTWRASMLPLHHRDSWLSSGVGVAYSP